MHRQAALALAAHYGACPDGLVAHTFNLGARVPRGRAVLLQNELREAGLCCAPATHGTAAVNAKHESLRPAQDQECQFEERWARSRPLGHSACTHLLRCSLLLSPKAREVFGAKKNSIRSSAHVLDGYDGPSRIAASCIRSMLIGLGHGLTVRCRRSLTRATVAILNAKIARTRRQSQSRCRTSNRLKGVVDELPYSQLVCMAKFMYHRLLPTPPREAGEAVESK